MFRSSSDDEFLNDIEQQYRSRKRHGVLLAAAGVVVLALSVFLTVDLYQKMETLEQSLLPIGESLDSEELQQDSKQLSDQVSFWSGVNGWIKRPHTVDFCGQPIIKGIR